MDQVERAQARLIIENSGDLARKAVNDRLKAIYADHAARGLLRSGATVKAGLRAMEEEASRFITGIIDQVAGVAKDVEAFAMVRESLEPFLSFLAVELDGAVTLAVGAQGKLDKFKSVDVAAKNLLLEARGRLVRQLELHRFAFIVPAPSWSPLGLREPKPIPSPAPQNKGGKPLVTGSAPAPLNCDKRKDWVPPGEVGLSGSATRTVADPPKPFEVPFVFLSYANQDHLRVGALHKVLQEASIPLWWDQDILPGTAWRAAIAERLKLAKAVVTFWTKDSTASKAVIEEAATAQREGKLIHVRLDDAPLPYGFAETQYLDLRKWDGTASHPEMRKLIQALRDRITPPTKARDGHSAVSGKGR